MARQPGIEFLLVPFVQQQIADAVAFAAKVREASLRDDIVSQLECSVIGEVCEGWQLAFDSPLEAAYWAWWRVCEREYFRPKGALDMARHVEVTVADGDRYVLDGVVTIGGETRGVSGERRDYIKARWPKIAVELDGHAFHEKTLEQVTKRNRRDRALQRDGWQVFHYSFSEFVANPFACVNEPGLCALGHWNRLGSEFFKHKYADAFTAQEQP